MFAHQSAITPVTIAKEITQPGARLAPTTLKRHPSLPGGLSHHSKVVRLMSWSLLLLLLTMSKHLQLNTRSLNTSHHLIKSYVEQRNIDALSLTETFEIKTATTETFEIKDNPLKNSFKIAPLPRPGTFRGGVAALYRCDVKFWPRNDLRLDGLEATWYETIHKGTRYLVGTVYIPGGSLQALSALDRVLSKIDADMPLLLMGDFNSRHLAWEHWHRRQPPYSSAFKMGEAVLGICSEHKLTIGNDGRHTRDEAGRLSAPDLTLYRGLDVTWDVDHITRLNSDHLPIIISLPKVQCASHTKWDIRRADWNLYERECNSTFDNFHEATEHLDPHETASKLSKCFKDAADKSLQTRRITKHSKGFMTEELKKLLQKARDAQRKYKKRSDTFNRRAYLEAVEIYTTKFHEAGESHEKELYKSLSVGDPSMWAKISTIKGHARASIQPLKDGQGKVHFKDEEICNILIAHHVNPPPQTDRDMEWFHLVNTEYLNIVARESENLEPSPEDIHNRDITKTETTAAIRDMKNSPGPDGVLPELVKKAGPKAETHVLSTYQKCFEQGIFPDPWKRENRLFIPKPDKLDYNVSKAYRGVAMTDVPGKGYERVLTHRITDWISESYNWDPAQFAYRKHHSVTQGIMFYVLTVILGWHQGKDTVTAFVDLEGAFDRVWREAIIYQLYQAGLRGRLLMSIVSFLKNRMVRCLVNGHISDWLCALLGVPQGSVLAPILFLFFIRDLGLQLRCHMSFADDLTLSNTCYTINECIVNTEEDLKLVKAWCFKWGQHYHKTEVMFHTKQSATENRAVIDNGHVVPQVRTRKLLGVIIDKDLNFKDQIEYAAGKAESSLNAINRLLGVTSTEVGLLLAKSLATAHIERTYPAWCFTTASLKPIEKFHRRVLLRCTGAMASTSTSQLEVFCNTLPVALKLQELVLLEYARLCRIPGNHPLKMLLNSLLIDNDFIKAKINSPAHTISHLIATTHLKPHTVQPILEVPLKQLLEFRPPQVVMGPALGAAGNRTREQITAARQHTIQTLAGFGDDEVLAFTDGSALGNPGPCGAAAVIYLEGIKSSPIILNKSVALVGTSYLGELEGINMATEYIDQATINPKSLSIFVDCSSAISSASQCRQRDSHQDVVNSIQSHTNSMIHKGCSITYHKIAAHVNLEPNEIADKKAKEAAVAAKSTTHVDISWQTFKALVRQATTKLWQRQWDRQNEQRLAHLCFPKVVQAKLKTGLHRAASSARIRLISSHSRLADHMHKIGLSSTAECSCGTDRQTPRHILLDCPEIENHRQHMIDTIERAYIRNEVRLHNRTITMKDILAPNHGTLTNLEIHAAFAKFTQTCPFKI
jgi:ribonuclease HI